MQLTWAREGPNEFWRTALALLPLYIWAEVVPLDVCESAIGVTEEEAQFELHVVAMVRNVDGHDEQVGFDATPLPDFGPDSDPNEDVALYVLTFDMMMALNVRAHSDVRRELENTEEDLKRLRAIERQMSRVSLIHESGQRIVLTLDLARTILALKDVAAQRPWRIELESPILAACYNEQGFIVGRIVYRPELNNGDRPGRMGLYPYEDNHE